MTVVKKYRAFDGTEFEDELDCSKYENVHRYDGIKMWDSNGKRVANSGLCSYKYVETEEQSKRFERGTMPVGLIIPRTDLDILNVEAIVKIAKEIGWLKEETKKRQIDTMTEEALTKVITDWRNGVYCQGERCDCSVVRCSEALAHYLLSPTKESK